MRPDLKAELHSELLAELRAELLTELAKGLATLNTTNRDNFEAQSRDLQNQLIKKLAQSTQPHAPPVDLSSIHQTQADQDAQLARFAERLADAERLIADLTASLQSYISTDRYALTRAQVARIMREENKHG